MKFTERNLEALAEMIVGDVDNFPYRSSKSITCFFEDCGLHHKHDGSTRRIWVKERLSELLTEPQPRLNSLPDRFVNVIRVLMRKSDSTDNDPNREKALASLNTLLNREGFEGYYGEDNHLYIRHIETQTQSMPPSPHRPLTLAESQQKERLASFLDTCSEDELIEQILLPLFRSLGFERVTASGHRDKALEYGKDVWMRIQLPTQHMLYFGIQAKKGKIDAAGATRSGNANIAEIHQQVLMMLGHEIFDPETSKKVLVDHAFIVSGGEITKQARNWIGGKLDTTKRSQIMFMDREEILNLYVVNLVPLKTGPDPTSQSPSQAEQLPF